MSRLVLAGVLASLVAGCVTSEGPFSTWPLAHLSLGMRRRWLMSIGRQAARMAAERQQARKSLVGGLACRKRLALRSSNVKLRLP